jgi:hypothetical protein
VLFRSYVEHSYDSYAPIMMGEELAEGGRVVSGGIIYGLRGTVDMRPYYFREGEMDNLFDCIFQWLTNNKAAGSVKVLWYEGGNVYDRNKISTDASLEGCKAFADALRGNFGYTMDYSAASITPELLESYDVLVLPQLQSMPDDATVDNIVAWVRSENGGLVLLDQSEYGSNSHYEKSNRILEALGATHRFQHDQINVGESFYFPARVDETTPIGAAYGAPEIYVASVCSLRIAGRSVSVTLQLEHKSGLPGETLE